MSTEHRSKLLPVIAKALLSNSKYDFGPIKVGRYTLVVTKHIDVAEKIIPLLVSGTAWLQCKKAGGKFMVIDVDVKLNVGWARIWQPVPSTYETLTKS